jgi:hypothetical protein
MLFKRIFLDRIAAGSVSLAFRRWRKPTVQAGGTLKTPIGVLAITDVLPVDKAAITADQIRKAGYASRADLLRELDGRTDGTVYRISFHLAGPDPRLSRREKADPTPAETATLLQQLASLDRRRARTGRTLDLIRRHPAVRAPIWPGKSGRKPRLSNSGFGN